MVLVGGTGIPFGQNLNKKVYCCDLAETNADGAVVWRELAVQGKCPEARYGQVSVKSITKGDFLSCISELNLCFGSGFIPGLVLRRLLFTKVICTLSEVQTEPTTQSKSIDWICRPATGKGWPEIRWTLSTSSRRSDIVLRLSFMMMKSSFSVEEPRTGHLISKRSVPKDYLEGLRTC